MKYKIKNYTSWSVLESKEISKPSGFTGLFDLLFSSFLKLSLLEKFVSIGGNTENVEVDVDVDIDVDWMIVVVVLSAELTDEIWDIMGDNIEVEWGTNS